MRPCLVDSTCQYFGSLPQGRRKDHETHVKPPAWSSLWGPPHRKRMVNPNNMAIPGRLTSCTPNINLGYSSSPEWRTSIKSSGLRRLIGSGFEVWHSFGVFRAIWRNVWTNPCAWWKKASPATSALKTAPGPGGWTGWLRAMPVDGSGWKRGKHSDWRNLQNETASSPNCNVQKIYDLKSSDNSSGFPNKKRSTIGSQPRLSPHCQFLCSPCTVPPSIRLVYKLH